MSHSLPVRLVVMTVLFVLAVSSAVAATPDFNRRARTLEIAPPTVGSPHWTVRCSSSVAAFSPLASGKDLSSTLRLSINNAPVDSVSFSLASGGTIGNCACYGGCTEYCDVSEFGCWCGYIITGLFEIAPAALQTGDVVTMSFFAAPGSEPEQFGNDDILTTTTLDVNDGPPLYRGDYIRLMSANPSRTGFVRVQFSATAPKPVEVAVYNLMGRKVKVLAARSERSGTHELIWDKTDDRGRKLPPGVYMIQLAGERQLAATRLIILN